MKEKEYEKRYSPFKESGYQNYKNKNKEQNVTFMQQGHNYKFQWARINQIDGNDSSARGERYPALPKIMTYED